MENRYICVIILFVGLCHGVSKASQCTARGRFPNDESNDCRGYTMCLTGGLTNFTQYKLICPMGSVYSHIEEQCTNATNYKCYPSYNCTRVGNFVNPEGTGCSSYIACIDGLGGLSTARLVECPPKMLFNATVGVCVDSTDYTCTSFKAIVDDHVVDHDINNNMFNNAININFRLSSLFLISFLLLMLI